MGSVYLSQNTTLAIYSSNQGIINTIRGLTGDQSKIFKKISLCKIMFRNDLPTTLFIYLFIYSFYSFSYLFTFFPLIDFLVTLTSRYSSIAPSEARLWTFAEP